MPSRLGISNFFSSNVFMFAIIAVLVASNIVVWSKVSLGSSGNLRVYFLNVGQGDAILIESPAGGRVLIDGGPDRRVLSELGEVLPFGDRRIDVLVESHPDADHITGLVEVLRGYEVGAFIQSGVESSNEIDNLTDRILDEKDIKELVAKRGMTLDLGSGAVLEILFPHTDVSGWETNEATTVSKLTFGESTFLFTGDSTKRAEYLLLELDGGDLDVDVLQVGHHGSETSSGPLYIKTITPEYSVISSGKDNRYGHPHKITLDTLAKFGTKILNTAHVGRVEFVTNGETLELK